MVQENSASKIRVSVAPADDDGHVVMVVSTGSVHDFHRISLAEARALSLALIKQVNRYEVSTSKQQVSEPEPSQPAATPLRYGHQS